MQEKQDILNPYEGDSGLRREGTTFRERNAIGLALNYNYIKARPIVEHPLQMIQ